MCGGFGGQEVVDLLSTRWPAELQTAVPPPSAQTAPALYVVESACLRLSQGPALLPGGLGLAALHFPFAFIYKTLQSDGG